MPDLEERVTTLEREMSALKERVGTNEDELKTIPDLIRVEFRLTNCQISRLSRDVGELQRGWGDLAAKVHALPRVVAELVVETLAERDKKR